MSVRVRAAYALVVLAGFFLLGAVLLAAMALLDWLLLTRWAVAAAAWLEATLVTSTLLAAVVIVQGMLTFLRAGRLRPLPEAVPVPQDEEPGLWQVVRAAAEACGERAPDELFLTDEVNASVAEQSRMLGLLPGRRRMTLGLPLLAGLTLPQLRAVLAHEFGHYSNRDTGLGGVIMRGRAAVLHTVEMFQRFDTGLHSAVGGLYVGYARMFLRTSQAVARAQELAADRSAARHAGREVTASALRVLPVLDTAYAHYLKTYAGLGIPFSTLPPHGEFLGGFRRLLAARPGERLAELGTDRRPARPHPYDSHPPIAERVALVEQLADPASAADRHGGDEDGTATVVPALTLLRHADDAFTALETRALPAEMAGWPRSSWDELARSRAVADAEEWAEPLRTAVTRTLRSTSPQAAEPVEEPGLEEVLAAIDRGLLWEEIAVRMPRPHLAGRLTGASYRNFIRPKVFDGLASLVVLHMAGLGRATPDIAWSALPGVALPPAWESGTDAAVEAAVADEPDTAPLRSLLATLNAQPAEAL